jgi:hypothetical protein
MTNTDLAALAFRLGRQHLPRTPGRRAAAALWVALNTTHSTDAARRALATFGTADTQAAAATLLDRLTQEGA